MYYRKDATGIVSETIEDLDISINENQFIGDAEVDCLMEYEGYDPGDWYTPPSGGCGWCYDTTVKSVFIYSADGEEVGESTDEKYLKMVQDWIESTDWMNENSDRLMEIWSEDERCKQEAALEAKFDAMRDERAEQYFQARHEWKAGEGPHPQ